MLWFNTPLDASYAPHFSKLCNALHMQFELFSTHTKHSLQLVHPDRPYCPRSCRRMAPSIDAIDIKIRPRKLCVGLGAQLEEQPR